MAATENHSTTVSEEELFSVLSLNLRFGLADDGANSWPHRRKGLAALLKAHSADFIGLQEANDFQIEFVARRLTRYGYIGKRKPAPSFWQNNVLFYNRRWQCHSHRHFFLSPTPDVPSRFRESRWPRQCTVGMFRQGARQLICLNTHLDFKSKIQRKSAQIILAELARFPAEVPAVLMGDFNSSPEGACHMVFTGRAGEGEGRFTNVFTSPYPGTFHGFSGKSTGDCIDWILFRGGIRPIDCGVIRETFEGVYPSDHFPIRTLFRWEDG